MLIESVDPRDVRWEVDHPRYRVYFWWGDVEASTSSEYELSGPDVDAAAVLAWAAVRVRELGAERYEVFAMAPHGADRLGAVRIRAAG